jgi:hypothetical protein
MARLKISFLLAAILALSSGCLFLTAAAPAAGAASPSGGAVLRAGALLAEQVPEAGDLLTHPMEFPGQ